VISYILLHQLIMNGVKEIVNENESSAETIDITAFQRVS